MPQLAIGSIQASDLCDLNNLENLADTKTNLIHLENDFRVSITQSNQDKSADAVTTSIILDSQLLWSADIRSETFKDQEKKKRSRLAFVNKSLKLSLYFIAFILLSELLLSGANLWLTQYASKVEIQAPTVRRIEDQHTLINKLEQISQNELRPIALLEQANLIRSMISSNIIYDNVDITKENEVTIKGTAGSVNDLNRYVSKLNQSKNFNVLEDPKYITRGGKTTFTLKMYYKSEKSSI